MGLSRQNNQYNPITKDIGIGVSTALSNYLIEKKKEIPLPIKAKALIDTGATFSVIKSSLVSRLGLYPIGLKLVTTVGKQNMPCKMYATKFYFSENISYEISAISNPLMGLEYDCLIGRDILDKLVLVYNGKENHFRLSF